MGAQDLPARGPRPQEGRDRAARVGSFREELAQAELDRAVLLTEEQRQRLLRYHEGVLRSAAGAPREPAGEAVADVRRRTSVGEGITGAVVSCALGAFLVWLWRPSPTPLRIVGFLAGSLAFLAATHAVSGREKWRSLAFPLGLGALGCFAAETLLLARAGNIGFLPHGLLTLAAFALAMAYSYRLPVLLAAGILASAVYFSALVATAGGALWTVLGSRPETFFPAGVALLAAAALVPHPGHPGFRVTYVACGLVALLGPVLILANWGGMSYVRAPDPQVQALYLALGFSVAGLAIVSGLWWRSLRLTGLGVAFSVVFLCVKFLDHPAVVAGGLLAAAALALLSQLYRPRSGSWG